MLGILLAILKCIGLLFLGILLVLLFVVLVVLLSPIRYRLEGERKEGIKGNFSVRWFFGALKIDGIVCQGEEPVFKVRFFGFSLLGEKKEKKKRKRKKKTKPVQQKMGPDAVITAREKPQEAKIVVPTEPTPKPVIMEEAAKEETQQRVRRVKLTEIQEKPIVREEIPKEEESFFTGEATEQEDTAFQKAKEAWAQFQAVEGKKEIYHALIKLLKRLKKGILPKDFRLRGTVGLGEVEWTGYFMGLMGILTAKFGENIQVKADFTRLVAEDIEIQVKGKMVMGYFLYAAMAFVLTKPIRRILIKLWKGRWKNG